MRARAGLRSPPSFDENKGLDSLERENEVSQACESPAHSPVNCGTEGDNPALSNQEQEASPNISRPKRKGKEIACEDTRSQSPKKIRVERDNGFMVILEMTKGFAPPPQAVPEPVAPSPRVALEQAASLPGVASERVCPPTCAVSERVPSSPSVPLLVSVEPLHSPHQSYKRF